MHGGNLFSPKHNIFFRFNSYHAQIKTNQNGRLSNFDGLPTHKTVKSIKTKCNIKMRMKNGLKNAPNFQPRWPTIKITTDLMIITLISANIILLQK